MGPVMVQKQVAAKRHRDMEKARKCRIFKNGGNNRRTKGEISVNPVQRRVGGDTEQQMNANDSRNQIKGRRRDIKGRHPLPVFKFVRHVYPARLFQQLAGP